MSQGLLTVRRQIQGAGRSYTWLKWTSGAVLFVEGLVGVALPALMKMSTRSTWLVSLLNNFSGGVFLTFGTHGPLPLGSQMGWGSRGSAKDLGESEISESVIVQILFFFSATNHVVRLHLPGAALLFTMHFLTDRVMVFLGGNVL